MSAAPPVRPRRTTAERVDAGLRLALRLRAILARRDPSLAVSIAVERPSGRVRVGITAPGIEPVEIGMAMPTGRHRATTRPDRRDAERHAALVRDLVRRAQTVRPRRTPDTQEPTP